MDVISKFILQANQPFTECFQSKSCTSAVTATSRQRTGQLLLELEANQQYPIKATFYSPNQDSCTGERSSSCEFYAIFQGNELDSLIANSGQLKHFQPKPVRPPLDPPPAVDPPSPTIPTEPDGGIFGHATTLVGNNIVPISALVFLLLLVLGRKHIVRLVFPRQSRQRPSQPLRSEPVNFQAQGLNQIFNPSLESSSEINRQLLPLIRKIDLLSARLDSLETELTVISQKSQPSVSFSTPPIQQTARTSHPVINNLVPKPRPALDVDLIKLAVATSDYELIKAFPHNFVTETLESRQGMEEGLRFSIDGDQDQSDQRAQSEFIAIPYLNETYLIPNLLPNAVDPARTIRRFVERNKLYRGTGDNLLSITELATVTRSGDSYTLLTSGRVG